MKGVMIQGTSSDSGKSFIVTGLCRLMSDMRIKICPFKSQNMSNNAYVTHDNCEMSTAQAMQAQAARLTPEVFMNPILLKPQHDKSSEIILNGKVFPKTAAKNYYREFAQGHGIQAIRKSLQYIHENFEAIIIEGAGSPAEINLNAHEIVNMRIAREANVPVILVTDVDRGGSLASIVGTLELLGSDKERVKGIIFNKFRGDINLFHDAVEWTENYTGVKVLGVLPFMKNVNLSGEDSLNLKNLNRNANISIGIINFPGIANFSDFDSFMHENDVNLIYVNHCKEIHELDAIILPGSKNTFAALEWLKENNLDSAIKNFHGHIFAICGGLQILGMLDILPVTTSFDYASKITRQITGVLESDKSIKISGYEIHFGRTKYNYDENFHALFITDSPEGIVNKNFTLAGTYIHGIFDNDEFRTLWLNNIRKTKKIGVHDVIYTHSVKENSFNQIAKLLAENLDINFILKLILHEGTTPQHE